MGYRVHIAFRKQPVFIRSLSYLDALKISCFRKNTTKKKTAMAKSIPMADTTNMTCATSDEKSGFSAILGGESDGGY